MIKTYASQRRFNTVSSPYGTPNHLTEAARDRADVMVYDAKTNEDLTCGVLTQIIFDGH